MESLSALFPFALILVAFYFLIIRPTRNRARAQAAMQERLTPGVEVMTTAGIYGRVRAVDAETVSLEVAPGTAIRVAKAAVGRVLDDESPPDTAERTDNSTDRPDAADDESAR